MTEIKITHKDKNLRELEKRLRAIGHTSIKVGFQGKSGLERARQYNSRGRKVPARIRIVDLASIHHFGAPRARILRRPFMGVMGDRRVFVSVARRAARAVVRGESVNRALELGGIRLTALIRKRIVDLGYPPLAQSTRAARKRKRGDVTPNPLIDTGTMLRSVSSVQEVNGRRVGIVERKRR